MLSYRMECAAKHLSSQKSKHNSSHDSMDWVKQRGHAATSKEQEKKLGHDSTRHAGFEHSIYSESEARGYNSTAADHDGRLTSHLRRLGHRRATSYR